MMRRDTRLQGLMEAIEIIARVVGPMDMRDFNDKTLEMVCEINKRLFWAAGKAAEAEAEGDHG
jgi:hypothetical protein